MEKKRVLFICVHNSARSQMAEAFLNRLSDGFSAESAGIEPGMLNPLVIKAMMEDGYDISRNSTKSVYDMLRKQRQYDYVITVCSPEAAEQCPVFPGKGIKLHWEFEDPASLKGPEDEKLAVLRKIRDMIKEKIIEFIKQRSENHGD